ncbi:hypothetical protein [Roseateles sp.]|uniref:hypothetical protein n=1 Tax=Roseateles sp. TaxID=1971397 RepID=UPI003937BD59
MTRLAPLWLLAFAAATLAAEPQPAPAPQAAPREAPRPAVSEPKIEQIVVEDDAVRIEELRVRGETRKVIVKQKHGPAPAYEVWAPETSRASAGGSEQNLTAGRRVWRVLDF